MAGLTMFSAKKRMVELIGRPDADVRLSGEVSRVGGLVIESELAMAGRRVDSYEPCIAALRARDARGFADPTRDHIEVSGTRRAQHPGAVAISGHSRGDRHSCTAPAGLGAFASRAPTPSHEEGS